MTVLQQKHKEREMDLREVKEKKTEVPFILEEVTIEELAVDGICGIY